MKKNLLFTFTILSSTFGFGQEAGNINYQNQVRYQENNINVDLPNDNDLYFSVKGLTNVRADNYVAIFNTFQVGKTTEEVNELIEKRINQAVSELKLTKGIEVFVDMISFVPIYEFEVEKKVFSKKTYNEVPVGFELKKNIHIKYSDQNLFNQIMSIMSKNEIYDLVRVDYFSNNLESVKKELMNKAKVNLQEKIKNYETILGVSFLTNEKSISEGYKVVFPVEMYKSYQAFNSTSLNLKKSANINSVEKTTTLYYQPIVDKEFDFVVNPTVLEPVIQVMFEIKMKINRESKQTLKNNKEYMLITPNGEMKNLNINQQ
ncbi:Protein of unknown function [Flavobacterium psychrophilum DSM 3660]|uniref:SIMPL domain-containing protein n=1 Tax=Flavobacterium psychrophilum TaxID=96345 RepID=UPI0004F839EA|nr:SIMPL domain-containing protein [Flavobacterium psychrophilum]AIN74058.1 hypothetical protein FPG3_06635 [Flavobacterium psychrophilum FPG3]MBF2045472.1 SIMPL domain-containing protein [Flavobacterium psychrophilum]OXB04773.1 SIMPL domain-containing protein [Flavobacterium psychrophilum DSM 3660 = ATCC 49418]SCY40678.1 Protein of unknown function [Flavobacterium psychrophilum DSM 3660] [Flavobacterium psychrophilum DSM 3660 = ATCC 49418]